MDIDSKIVEELNKLYVADPQRYINYISNLKEVGYRIFRNDDGKHKVQGCNIYEAYSGIFGDIFGVK